MLTPAALETAFALGSPSCQASKLMGAVLDYANDNINHTLDAQLL